MNIDMANDNINRREALKRLGKITLGVIGMSMLPRFEAWHTRW